jgi:hypothetical protein
MFTRCLGNIIILKSQHLHTLTQNISVCQVYMYEKKKNDNNNKLIKVT